MSATILPPFLHRSGLLRWTIWITLWLGIAAPSWAGTALSGFPVTIKLNGSGPSGAPNTAYCRISNGLGNFGTTLVALCSTGQIVNYTGDASRLQWMTLPFNSYRYLISPDAEGQSPGTFDIYTSYGSYTSWKLVRLDHRDYYELMVHW